MERQLRVLGGLLNAARREIQTSPTSTKATATKAATKKPMLRRPQLRVRGELCAAAGAQAVPRVSWSPGGMTMANAQPQSAQTREIALKRLTWDCGGS
jgi:hypothetical protein